MWPGNKAPEPVRAEIYKIDEDLLANIQAATVELNLATSDLKTATAELKKAKVALDQSTAQLNQAKRRPTAGR